MKPKCEHVEQLFDAIVLQWRCEHCGRWGKDALPLPSPRTKVNTTIAYGLRGWWMQPDEGRIEPEKNRSRR